MEGSGMFTVDGIGLALFFQLNTLLPRSRFPISKSGFNPPLISDVA
jgi:hypothetical protein